MEVRVIMELTLVFKSQEISWLILKLSIQEFQMLISGVSQPLLPLKKWAALIFHGEPVDLILQATKIQLRMEDFQTQHKDALT